MCSHQKLEEGKMPICGYTNKPCTLCVIGNMNTLKQAERKEKCGKSEDEIEPEDDWEDEEDG